MERKGKSAGAKEAKLGYKSAFISFKEKSMNRIAFFNTHIQN